MINESSSRDQNRILWVAISLMIAVSTIVLALTLWMLYRSNFEQRVQGLQAMVRGQVSVIDAVARFDRQHSADVAGGSTAATLQQVVEGYSTLGGFGTTGEFVLGRQRGDRIEFLSEFRFPEKGTRKTVPLTTDRAAPMRRTLSNESGWMVGPDYRGERVLAAFEPITELDLGLVAKLDMREVNAPFIRAAAIALGIAGVIILTGGLLVLRMARPMVRRIEGSQRRFRTLLESAPDAMVIIDASGEIVMVNRRTEEVFGYSRTEMTGQPIEMLMPQRFRERHPEHVRSFFSNSSTRSMSKGLELRALSGTGREFPVEISLSPIETEEGVLVASSLRDITERQQTEGQIRKLFQAVEQSSSSVVITDLDGCIEYVNPKFTETTGYELDEVLGQNPRVLKSGNQPRQFYADLWATISSGGEWHGEFCNRKKNGDEYWEYASISPIRDATGEITHYVAIKDDITDKRNAEAALRRTKLQAETALVLSKAVSFEVTPDGQTFTASDKYVEMLGIPAAEGNVYSVQETHVANVAAASPDYAEKFAEAAAAALEDDSDVFDFTHPYRRPVDGEIIWLRSITNEVKDEDGNIKEIHGVAQDVTETIRMNQELEAARETAEAGTRAKSAFLANMSHELRTPMNAIIGYSEMLIEEADDLEPDEFVSDLTKIHSAGQHLLSLINDILDLSKIEAGRMDLYLERFDLQQLLAEARDTVIPLVEKNANRLETDFADDLGAVRADMTKVRQSLFNLLSNAAKFTHEGVIRMQARREDHDGQEIVLLSVSDTGIGIPDDRIEHVFDEFSQADQSTMKDYGGTGLGLAISRRFCRMMGGDLTAASTIGEGSTFTMVFPAEVDALEAARASEQPMAEPAAIDGGAPAPGTGSVLVIDDDPEARELLRRTLEADGLEVITAASGERGLELALEMIPSVITLDILMPGMDGWQVLRELKHSDVLRKIPVVLVTMVDEKGLGFALGATDYLAKPVNRDLLRRSVKRYAREDDTGRVLIVDDDESTRKVIRRALEAHGWQVDEAENGRRGLDLVNSGSPDVIILDLMMPVLDGFGFVTELRENQEHRNIPVMILTAQELSAEEKRFLEGRTDKILSKGDDAIASALTLVKTAISERRS